MTRIEDLLGFGGDELPQVTLPSLAPPAAGLPPPRQSYFSNLLRSSAASIPELVGVSPSRVGLDQEEIERWRAANPLMSIASQLVPSLVPYGLGVTLGRAALQSLPVASRIWANVAANSPRALSAPVSTAFARGALELTPFEIARLGVAGAVGDEGALRDTAVSAGLDLAVSGGLFAAGGLFRALRGDTSTGARVRAFVPDYDLRQPAQQRLQRLYDFRAAGQVSEDVAPFLSTEVEVLEQTIRGQGASGTREYVGELWNGADRREVARLFRDNNDVARATREPLDLVRRRFTQTVGNGFPEIGGWQREAASWGLPDGWLASVQYPRVLEARTPAGMTRVQNTISRNLRQVHDGWFIEPEQNSGLFLMARQRGDRWLLFKTNDPDRFIGRDVFGRSMDRSWKFQRATEGQIDRAALESLEKSHPDALLAGARRFSNTFSPEMMNTAMERGWSARALWGALPERLGNVAKQDEAYASDVWQMLKGYLAPAQGQFRKQPLAERTRIRGQQIFDMARARAATLSFGDETLEAGQSIYKRIFRPGAPKGVEGLVRSLDDADLPIVQKLLMEDAGLENVLRRLQDADPQQRERLSQFFRALDEIDTRKISEIKATERVYGIDRFEARPGHFGFSHLWAGDFRQRVVNEAGKLIAMGSGRTNAEAAASARRLAGELGGRTEGGVFRRADWEQDLQNANTIVRERSVGQPRVKGMAANEPGIYEPRKGVLGWVGSESTLTKRELADALHSNLRQHYDYLARTIMENELHQEVLDAGRRYGTEVMQQLAYRLRRIAGDKGWFDREQNRFVSKRLGNWLGSNAADKLTNGYKQLESDLSLGMGNMGYVAANALQFIQTVIPKIALIRGANPGRMAEFMGFIPDMDGPVAKGFLGIMDPLKIAAAGWRAMARPTAEQAAIFSRASREGVITRGAFEEFLGQKSSFGRDMLDASTTGQNPAIAALQRISRGPAQKTEELSRAHALLTGEILGRSIGVRDPEQLYQFAKQFSQRTMYGYTAGDRTKIFNGPAGGLFGLFKNWTFHYINDMGLYASEAFRRGNFAPLLWSVGSQGLLAGAGGLPLVAAVDGLQRMFGNRPLMDQLYSALGNPNESPYSDVAWFGLPAFLGVTLQSQLSAPFSDPVRDMTWLTNWAVLERARRVGGMMQYAMNDWRAGGNPFENERTWDLANYAFGPRISYKILSGVQDGALRAAQNGQPIISGVGPLQELLNGIGFTPTRIARAYEASAQGFADQNARAAATSRLGEAYARALERQDWQATTFIVQRALETGADLGSVMRSAAVRMRTGMQERLPTEFLRVPGALERQQLLGL